MGGNLFENSGRAEKPTYAMIQYFENRTNYHISLVRKYLDKIIALNDPRLDLAALEEEKEQHDLSKFKEPEYTPYLHVNWKYYMKERGAEYIPSNIIKRQNAQMLLFIIYQQINIIRIIGMIN
jgi:hypothetical protein